jgi:hypothetical protein
MYRTLPLLLILGCTPESSDTNTTQTTTTSTGTTTTPEPAVLCDFDGAREVAFDATGPAVYQRHEPAGDFSVDLRDGTTFTLSEQWTGCESYIFLPHWITVSAQDSSSVWTTGVDELIARSPANAHYFFVVVGSSTDDAEGFGSAIQLDIDAALAGMSADDAAFWGEHLHVSAQPSNDIDGLVGTIFSKTIGSYGFAVDRFQKIRTIGSFASVEAYDSALNDSGDWPYEQQLFSAAYESEYFNYEATRQWAMDQVAVTEVVLFDGEVYEQYEDGTAVFPDAATMAGFDTLEVDVQMECPDKDGYELGNCGEWDYLANLWFYNEETKSWLEIARFITTYHRESHWLVDASHALPWFAAGGEQLLRYEWAPSWNTQPTGITVKLRFSNQRSKTPVQAIPLFEGGTFDSTYNDRDPIEVTVPSEATRVEIVAIITGHGMEAQNCAEFCMHSHHFTVEDKSWFRSFDEAGSDTACQESVGTGTVPNQAGTWWYGRGGWCPGRHVDPYVINATNYALPGETVTVTYEGKLEGAQPPDGAGNIEMRSWMLIYN